MKSKIKIRIKQAIIIFLFLFFVISCTIKIQGNDRGGLPNPYGSSKLISPITWEEFYTTIPQNLLTALTLTAFVLTLMILGDKKTYKRRRYKCK